jgi:hypothetical protein
VTACAPGSGVDVGLYAAKSAVLVAAQLRLGNSATRLLLHMALECWDDEDNPMGAEPRRYYGRRELSAIALGYLAPANGTQAAYLAVKRAVRELVDKGAIARIRPGGNGRPAEYELKVPVSKPKRGGRAVLFAVPSEADQGVDERPAQRVGF